MTKKREKIVAISAGAFIAVVVIYGAVSKMLLSPAASLDSRAAELRRKNSDLERENLKKSTLLANLRDMAHHSFGNDELRTSELMRALLVEMLEAADISGERLRLQPVVGGRLPGVYKEIGWVVNAHGKLSQVVTFLYLLSEDPHLHRLDGLSLKPMGRGEVHLGVKYSTLVVEPVKGESMPSTQIAAVSLSEILGNPKRKAYDVIADRDLFRPYIKRAAVPMESVEGPAHSPGRGGGEAASPWVAKMKVVGLPTWGGQHDVYVQDPASNRVVKYKPGDALAGGTVLMVDYRVIPSPAKPGEKSYSRVILLIDGKFWAVELGQALADRRRLAPEELPDEIRKVCETQPAASGGSK